VFALRSGTRFTKIMNITKKPTYFGIFVNLVGFVAERGASFVRGATYPETTTAATTAAT